MSTTSSTVGDRFNYQNQFPAKRSFGDKLGDCFRAMLCCGGGSRRDSSSVEGSLKSAKVQISHPTDFRREEINIPGMTPSQEKFVREKALSDAKKLFENLQPLRSSPSSQFATRPAAQPQRISYEQFTQPRPSPKIPSSRQSNNTSGSPGWESIKAHGRKFSDHLKKPLQFGDDRRPSAGSFRREEDSAVEMRGLVEGSQSQVASPVVGTGKMSEESLWESDHAKAGVENRI